MLTIKKRGQVSIFFIIGIILLLILIIVLFMKSKIFTIPDNIVVPQQLMPAKNYIDYCIDRTSEEAFYILGRQGGFIEIPIEVRSNPDRRISLSGGAEILPYWYYENANWVPTIEFMESELNTYINEHFIECLNENELIQIGFQLRRLSDTSKTKVLINDKDITVEIDFPLEISTARNEMKTKIRLFRQTYDVKLKDMVDLAKYILVYENTYTFLENNTIQLMAMNGDIPFNGMIPECGVKTWHINNIKDEIQYALTSTFPEIRVEDTSYIPFEGDEDLYEDFKEESKKLWKEIEEVEFDPLKDYDSYEKDIDAVFDKFRDKFGNIPNDKYYFYHYFIPMKDDKPERYRGFSTSFQYSSDYGMDIQAKPSTDGTLKSNSIEGAQKYLSIFCMNMYHFTYDLTYPVIISLKDDDALKTQGFEFRFAIPVIIRDNEGLRSKQYMDFMPKFSTTDTFCLEGDGNNAIIKVYDMSQAGYLTIPEVNISMVCVKKKCPLGITEQHGLDAYLKINMPTTCGNPYLIAEKDGYLRSIYVVEDVEYDDLIDIDMIKLRNFSVDLKKHSLNPTDNKLSANGNSVSDGLVTIHLSGIINDAPYENNFVFEPGKENIIQLPVENANYRISITYFKNNEDYSGGYYDTWKVTREDLAQGNNIVFHFAEIILSTLDEDAAEAIASLDEIDSPLLEPEII